MKTQGPGRSMIRYSIFVFVIFMILFSPDISFGVESVHLLEVSSSGRSLKIDRGTLDGLREGTQGKFVLQKGLDNPKLSFVAEGEVIKTDPKQSHWFVKLTEKQAMPVPGDRLLLFTNEVVLKGRRNIKIRKRRIILRDDQTKEDFEKQEKLGIPEELIRKEKGQDVGQVLIESKKTDSNDIETKTFERWEDGEVAKKRRGIEGEIPGKKITLGPKLPKSEAVKNYVKRRQADVIVDGTIVKYNTYKGDLDGFYAGQARDENIKFMQKKGSLPSVFEKMQYEKGQREIIYNRDRKKISENGPLWSADLSEEELRRFFVRSGLSEEFRRQQYSLDNKTGNEIILRMSTGLSDKTTSQDTSYRGRAAGLGVGYEYHFMRVSEKWKRWTGEIFLDSVRNYYDLGGVNAESKETNWKLAFNFYLIGLPSGIDQILFHTGIGMKIGSAELTSNSLTGTYKFQVITLPTLQAGLKYRFSAGDEKNETFKFGVGFTGLVSYDLTTLTSDQRIVDQINGKVTTGDLRLALGVSTFF